MGIAFEPFSFEKFRVQIATLSDDELVTLGRTLRALCYPRRISPTPSMFDIQLEECRAEWLPETPRYALASVCGQVAAWPK